MREKVFAQREGKRSSCAAQGRRRMGTGAAAWILPWSDYKCKVGEDTMSPGCEGWGEECADGC